MRTILVTGVSTGIGRAIAEELLKKGFDFGSVAQGEGLDFDSGKIRRWKNF